MGRPLAGLLRPGARTSSLFGRPMVTGGPFRLAPLSATALRLDAAAQRIHEIDDLRRLALARRLDLLSGLLLLQQVLPPRLGLRSAPAQSAPSSSRRYAWRGRAYPCDLIPEACAGQLA